MAISGIPESFKIRFLAGIYAFTAFGLALTLKLDKSMAVIGVGIILMIIPIPILLFARGLMPKVFNGTDKRLFLLSILALVLSWIPFFAVNQMLVD